MIKATAIKYTADEKRTVDAGWYALMRAIESSRAMERRVDDAIKLRKRDGVSPAAARFFVMRTIQGAERQIGPQQMDYLAQAADDEVLCYFVGVWLRGRTDSDAYASGLWEALADAIKAHSAAIDRYLASIR